MNTEITAPLSIGDIIKSANNLSASQVEDVLAYQKQNGVKFGEAAVALGYVKHEDVLWALSQQFHYPYVNSNISKELQIASQPFSDQSEAIRNLRTQLLATVFKPEQPKRALAVVSPNIGDGKTYIAANLAVSLSQLGGRTLLVDADLRTPRQDQVFRIPNQSTGLSGVLSGRTEANVIRPVEGLPSLYVLPCGVTPPNPLELLQGIAFGQLIAELLSKFDYVVVDTPAAAHGSDARVVASICGASICVGRKGHTKYSDLDKLVATLSRNQTGFAGVVINEH